MEKTDKKLADGVKTYELGFLITPLLPEEEAKTLAGEKLAGLVARFGGQMVSEEAPKLIPLAYPIRQVVEHKGNVFREAYFGARRFTLLAEEVPALLAELKKQTDFIRTLLIILPRASMLKKVEKAVPAVIDQEIAKLI